jgi:exopolyphosphatase/guanosine-5'-triphosphate,3'-diphosphate pyrophosphatase
MTYAAAIDIGTHSALLLIAQCQGDQVRPQVDLARTTKLGESLSSTKAISPAALERLLAVLKIYQAILSEYPIQQLTVFGTAAFRLAVNADVCREAIARTFGWSLRILSGEEEADYTFKGVLQLFSKTRSFAAGATSRVVAIDIGGGSTEIISGLPGRVQQQWSIPVGAVFLKQQFEPGDCLTDSDIDRMVQFLTNHFAAIQGVSSPHRVFVTGGTATTLAALLLEMEEYDFRHIDGYGCTLASIEVLFRELNLLSTAQRADLPGMEAGRADVILPALVILRTLLNLLGTETITVTVRGARYGILQEPVGESYRA